MQWSDNFNESVHENSEELRYHNIAFSENLVSASLQHNRSIKVYIKYRYMK